MTVNASWLPPPDMTISTWSDENRYISSEASAEPGKWDTDRAPYQRGMLDAISNAYTERVVMMTSAQIGKTEILLNTIGYYIDKEPSPILMLTPTLEMGESFSKDRLAPMIRDTPCLTGKIADPRARDSGNTLLHKTFTGGHITIAGANSPASLASRPIRILLCDEVDRYPVSAGIEGDPLSLAMKRTANFWNRKIIWVSTPTLKEISRIEKAYELSTMEEYYVPCPKCERLSVLEWQNIRYQGLREPLMKCPHCQNEFARKEWHKNLRRGQWLAHNPGKNIRGFHVNSLISPWALWTDICASYEEARYNGEEALKVWHNTVLGLPYEVDASGVEIHELYSRGEKYPADLPDEVCVLTCGVDTQDDRLELEVVGWGAGRESWGIEYAVIYGDPGGSELWSELDEYLLRTWKYADGSSLGISCACIDSGGHYTEQVYRYVRGKTRRHIYAIIGRGTNGLPIVNRPSKNNRYKVPLFTLGVSTIKGLLYSRLSAVKGQAGYMHYPEVDTRGYTRKYYEGLTSEKLVVRRVGGIDRAQWVKRVSSARNEPLDCRVYATGALEILNPKLEKRQAERTEPSEKAVPSERKRVYRSRGMLYRGLRM